MTTHLTEQTRSLRDVTEAREAAQILREKGIQCVPIPSETKAPKTPDWLNRDFGPDDFGSGCNIGVKLGATAGDLVDCDLDCREAVEIAEDILPETGWVHGRTSNPKSHYGYVSAGLATSTKYLDLRGAVIAEIRSDRHQTVIPPSRHSGEDIVWYGDPTPAVVVPDEVTRYMGLLASIVLVARAWPQGSRHDAALAFAGFLATRGFDPRQVETALAKTVQLAGDEETRDRLRAARDTSEKAARGEAITSRLTDFFPSEVLSKLNTWLGHTADDFPLSETGDAEYFATHYGDRVRYDHTLKSWLVLGEHHWSRDDRAMVEELLIDSMRRRQRDATAIGDSDRRQTHAKWTFGGESRRRQENALKIARGLSALKVSCEDWDTDPFLLGVPNGVVDLRTGVLRDGRPDDRITMVTRTLFGPNATCTLWDETVSQIFDGDTSLVGYLQRALGYSLTGNCREECLFFNWGQGRNGKGTIMNTVAWVLGDYADDVPFSTLELHPYRNAATNDLRKLFRKRYVTASESGETTRLNEARIKALTGRDPVTARFLHQEFVTFEPDAKFWLATNDRPEVRDTSEGFWSRIHLIPYTQTFSGKENRTLKDRLREEGPGILAWLVRGCQQWQERGLDPPEVVREATNDYRTDSDTVAPFLDVCCVRRPGAEVRANELYRTYKTYVGDSAMSQKAFGIRMKGSFGSMKRASGVVYLGIGLRDEMREGQGSGLF